jgi:hypothetical protein
VWERTAFRSSWAENGGIARCGDNGQLAQPRCLSSHVCIRNKEGARKGPYWGNTIAIGTGRADTAECTTLVANALMKNMPVKILRNPDAVRIS